MEENGTKLKASGRPSGTEVDRARRLLWIFVAVVLAGFAVARLNLPWSAAALGFGAAGIVLGILTAVRIHRLRLPRALFIAVALGLGASVMLFLAGLGLIVFWPVFQDYQNCMDSALTEQAKDACMQQYQETFKELTGVVSP
ncbi:hypothetical protein KIH31_06805 [Paenarthrobacter sp. DKR-5]|uniref:hypothetical protein n=1 Tax=Paenarthrobacter sp. DKR-5 TaxID=2835535 RepID=UPI001BDC8CA9|nr:hypothetical protein [Paenarthrobacter sp. DKR-5]MBT1002308.1 hypothetical protein [Paenarthrobacter sp. DKR-5]